MTRKVVIDRKTWYRGRGERSSRLLIDQFTVTRCNEENKYVGHMCCLGFAGLQLFPELLTEKKITGIGALPVMPMNKRNAEYSAFCDEMARRDSVNHLMVYEINDLHSVQNREALLIERFKLAGVELEFVN